MQRCGDRGRVGIRKVRLEVFAKAHSEKVSEKRGIIRRISVGSLVQKQKQTKKKLRRPGNPQGRALKRPYMGQGEDKGDLQEG